MITYHTVWASDKNIGRAYNQIIEQAKDWVCFTDGDAMFLYKWWGKQLEDIIKKYEKRHVGMYTCMTNRVFNKSQLIGGKMSENFDLQYHNKLAANLAASQYDIVTPLTKQQRTSGVLMLVNPKASNVQFREGIGLAGVDNFFHTDLMRAGWKVMLMKGVYIFHKYDKDRSHLK